VKTGCGRCDGVDVLMDVFARFLEKAPDCSGLVPNGANRIRLPRSDLEPLPISPFNRLSAADIFTLRTIVPFHELESGPLMSLLMATSSVDYVAYKNSS
jgi:hypothetical protein